MVQHDLEVAYLGLQVPDPSQLSPFFQDVVGLLPGDDSADDNLTWRNDNRIHRVIVQQGDRNDATFVGFEATGDAAFDRTCSSLVKAGYNTIEATTDECAQRRVERMVHIAAPWGIQVEVVQTLQLAATPYSSPLNTGGFLTDGVGFGHVVFATTAFDESHRFLIEGLGFAQSDWIELEIAEGTKIEIRFYHCNERHHTVALAKFPFDLPQTLHHIMFETNERDDVGLAFDRAWATGLTIPKGLGRHDNDKMFSFYVESPSGFQVEVGHGGRRIGDNWDDNRRYDQTSVWGHQPQQRP